MKRRILSILLAAALLLTMLPVEALAGETGGEAVNVTVTGFSELDAEIAEQTIPQLVEGGTAQTPNLPETLSASAEGSEEPIVIENVSWSNSDYDQSVAADYVYTAILPLNYSLADGVNLPTITVKVTAGEPVDNTPKDFTVAAATEGETLSADDYSYENGVLTIKSGKAIMISGTDSATKYGDRVEIAADVNANLTVNNVNIDTLTGNAILLNSKATLKLTLMGNNSMQAGEQKAGICVPEGTTVDIGGEGYLHVIGGRNDAEGGAGIGGDRQGTVGKIIISGGKIETEGPRNRKGGGGLGNGGWVSNKYGSVEITGGYIKSTGGGQELSIRVKDGISVENAFIDVDVQDDHFDGDNARKENCVVKNVLYGSCTIKNDWTIPEGTTVEVEEGETLTVAEGFKLINNGTLKINGSFNGTLINNKDADNAGTITGPVANSGTFINDNIINGTVSNTGNSSGSFKNNGTITGSVSNEGTSPDAFTNSGSISGKLTNSGGLENSGTISGDIVNEGAIRLMAGKFTANSYSGDGTVVKDISAVVDGAGVNNIRFEKCLVAGGFWILPGTLTEDEYSYAGGVLTIKTDEPITIFNKDLHSTVADSIVIDKNVTANVTLRDVGIVAAAGNAILLKRGAVLNLTLEGNNSITTEYDVKGKAAICVPRYTTINIGGSGSLDVFGGYETGGAAIGADFNGTIGTINISGGNITATSKSESGAAIGSGGGRSIIGYVTITGGHLDFRTGNNSVSVSGKVSVRNALIETKDNNFDNAEKVDCIVKNKVYGSYTLKENWGAQSNVSFEVTEGGTFTVDSGVSFNVETQITNNGTIINNGTFKKVNASAETQMENNGAIINNGTFTNEGRLKNSGEITSGGTLVNASGATIFNDNLIKITESGKLINAGTITNAGTIIIIGAAENSGKINSYGTITGDITGDGTTEIAGTEEEYSYIDAEGNTKKHGAFPIVQENMNLSGWYVVKDVSTISGRLEVVGDVSIILANGGDLTVSGGIHVGEGNSLTIYGQENNLGKLSIKDVDGYKAGIGGDATKANGPITINGGNLSIVRGSFAAGIGGGSGDWNHNVKRGGAGKNITINGGIIDIKHSGGGAAIGGGGRDYVYGVGGDGRNIYINGGKITIEAHDGAGIGGGNTTKYWDDYGYSWGTDIFITGGELDIHTDRYGFGIGAGWSGSCGTVTISGGKISITTANGSIGAIGGADESKKAVFISPSEGKEISVSAAASEEKKTSIQDSPFTQRTNITSALTGKCNFYSMVGNVEVTVPEFGEVTYGYDQPEAKPITIKNTSEKDITITEVTVDGEAFAISGSGASVAAGESITTWAVRPAASLNADTYIATIRVFYNNDEGAEAASCSVKFVVKGMEQTAVPDAPKKISATTDQIILEQLPKNPETDAEVEYKMDDGGWQNSPNYFYWLEPATSYTFRARYKRTYCYEPSAESAPVTYYTPYETPDASALSFEGNDSNRKVIFASAYEVNTSEDFASGTNVESGSTFELGTLLYVRAKANGEIPHSDTITVRVIPDENEYVKIEDEVDLAAFAKRVNEGEIWLNAVLTKDIDMSGVSDFVPICSTGTGFYSEEVTGGYEGTFDGRGHIIKNLTLSAGNVSRDASGSDTVGLFGTIRNTGIVKKLGMENFKYEGTSEVWVGAIAGQLYNGGRIEDCYVINSNISAGAGIAGGFSGGNFGGIIERGYTFNNTLSGARFGNIVGDNDTEEYFDNYGIIENTYFDYSTNYNSTSYEHYGYSDDYGYEGAEELKEGEVAFSLNGTRIPAVWGARSNTDLTPILGGNPVLTLRSGSAYSYISGKTAINPGERIATQMSSWIYMPEGGTLFEDGTFSAVEGGTLTFKFEDNEGYRVTAVITLPTGGRASIDSEGNLVLPRGSIIEIDGGDPIVPPRGGIINMETGEITDSPFKVTFDSMGGSEVESQPVEPGETAFTPEEPVRKGYIFEGWFTDKGYTTEWNFENAVDDFITLYAKWTKESGGETAGRPSQNTYSLRFETDGGSEIYSVLGSYGTIIDLSEYVTVKKGFTFAGWYSDSERTVPVKKITLNGNRTVYAKWTEEEINPNTGIDLPLTGLFF